MPGLEAVGLVQSYGSRTVISGLTMRADAGVVALLGPNGAGKSTLLKTLATVTPPGGGELRLLGRRITGEKDVREVRKKIGYLPQEFGYHPNFSVYEFVRYCAWLREVPDRKAHEATLRALEQVGLADRRKNRMRELSGGMLRRAGIAQAIVGDVELILLDEPTVGLDPEQRLDFRRLIRTLASTATVVLSTHLVEDVAAVCTCLHVITDGRIVFSGTPAELAANATPDTPGDTPLESGYIWALRSAAVPA
ncbi:ABC-2 type transport system ATP-binding protein [Streptosporangium becharense]|uniref:ABC-2 type transport system ATP-binding protein n=1 Tax=Streptosporangium becharense TaxID=1816182 RepID=A0A7W9IJN6_9ACTN|nr:ABC transporter ATP-binding protein [Streptosporangium becharense]MBB2911282.1 ABC-2 type transport system ATP-binding protein [Streptosporangium becharense]MBB5821660.1 ABC-2 type transport system ATP-binding protein [Streptosporangium becharense]